MAKDFAKIRRQDKERAWVLQRLAEAQLKNWYGTFIITMHDGLVKRMDKTETELPPEGD